jgi:hypothetical protein
LEINCMNDKQRAEQYLDGLTGREMRFCTAKGGCACMGCIHQATYSQVIEYLLDKIVAIKNIEDERRKEKDRELRSRLDERKGAL